MQSSSPLPADSGAVDVAPPGGLPPWGEADLPEPQPLRWRNWLSFLGPGLVMMGIQIGGGEWLIGPLITAKYGGGLMWIATVAIVLQIFYNMECGRYALYTGEPMMTGFMRTRPGPRFWVGIILLLSLSSLIPALSTNAAVVIASLILDRPPGAEDQWLVMMLAFACLLLVAAPILIGGKVYNMLQVVMTTKVFVVLSFCLAMGLLFVRPEHWANVMSGFLKFGHVPVADSEGKETVVNVFGFLWREGHLPTIVLANIAVIGAFAGYAGGGGLANSTYSNYVRDKGWGMGSRVGAIASAVGGRNITLSHVGKVFPLTKENLSRWSQWWRYIQMDQILVWGPGCFMGMALPALLSLQFAGNSELYSNPKKQALAQAIITADGIRHAPEFGPVAAKVLWVITLLVGLMVLLPSQMSIVEDVSRRWTDIIWTANRRVRETMHGGQAKYIYYSILFTYVVWTFIVAALFAWQGTPKLMVEVIANLNNLAIGVTSFHVLWVNRTLLPGPLRPRWYQQTGVALCGIFYVSLFLLVLVCKLGPEVQRWFR